METQSLLVLVYTDLHDGHPLLPTLFDKRFFVYLLPIKVVQTAIGGDALEPSGVRKCLCATDGFTHTSSSEDSWSTFMPSERLPLNLSSSRLCRLLLSRLRDNERLYCLTLPYRSLSTDLQDGREEKGLHTKACGCHIREAGANVIVTTCVSLGSVCEGKNESVAVVTGTSVSEVSDLSCGEWLIWDCSLGSGPCLRPVGSASCGKGKGE